MCNDKRYYADSKAIIDSGAIIGENTKIWANAHVCSKAVIGKGCNIGQNAYVDNNATVGSYCKLQNNVNVYDGVTLADYVFCGPSMTFTNVKIPRCEFPRDRNGSHYLKTRVGRGASLGALSVVVCGHDIGEYALIGSGSVVASDVPSYAIMVGNPARQVGWACRCGQRLGNDFVCEECGRSYSFDNDGNLHEIES